MNGKKSKKELVNLFHIDCLKLHHFEPFASSKKLSEPVLGFFFSCCFAKTLRIRTYFLWLSVSVMPCEDTLKCTTVAVGGTAAASVSDMALAMA